MHRATFFVNWGSLTFAAIPSAAGWESQSEFDSTIDYLDDTILVTANDYSTVQCFGSDPSESDCKEVVENH